MTTDIQTITNDLAELQYRRKFWLKRLNMTENALRALARRGMGWHWDLPEEERERLNKRAASLVAALMAGKSVAEADADVAVAIVADVEVTRQVRVPMEKARREIERDMEKLARELPVYEWVQTVRGFSALGLGAIVAETGDLSNYPNPDKVKRRLGLAPFSGHAGKTWRVETWRPRALDKNEWTEFGYSGQRRSVLWQFVDQNVERSFNGKYRALYDVEKARFVERGKAPIHAQAHARRRVSQEIVIDLWRVWNGYAPRDREIAHQGDGGGHGISDTQVNRAPAEPVAA